MKICIDTNAYTAFKRNHHKVISILEKADEIIIPTVVLGELFAGFYRGNKKEQNVLELEEFMSISGIEEFNTTRLVAERYGLIVKDLFDKGSPIPTNDIWIAAVAFETASRLLTFDAHFDKVPGLAVINPK
jgi:tRNA(fMet)-specific endonuclease VapC